MVTMISIRPPISKSSGPITKTLRTVPNTPISMYITVILMFNNFICSPSRSKYESLFPLYAPFGEQNPPYRKFYYVFFIFFLVHFTGFRWSVSACRQSFTNTQHVSYILSGDVTFLPRRLPLPLILYEAAAEAAKLHYYC